MQNQKMKVEEDENGRMHERNLDWWFDKKKTAKMKNNEYNLFGLIAKHSFGRSVCVFFLTNVPLQ